MNASAANAAGRFYALCHSCSAKEAVGEEADPTCMHGALHLGGSASGEPPEWSVDNMHIVCCTAAQEVRNADPDTPGVRERARAAVQRAQQLAQRRQRGRGRGAGGAGGGAAAPLRAARGERGVAPATAPPVQPPEPRQPRQRTCAACGAAGDGLKRCSGCDAVRYCGAACQRLHWAAHKDLCGGAAE
jgi:hypothetical protein